MLSITFVGLLLGCCTRTDARCRDGGTRWASGFHGGLPSVTEGNYITCVGEVTMCGTRGGHSPCTCRPVLSTSAMASRNWKVHCSQGIFGNPTYSVSISYFICNVCDLFFFLF